MLIEFCKSKVTYATVTQAELLYEGSITVDEAVLKAADILPGEKVQVVNLNNGQRFETYVIPGDAGSGVVCLNGPAARLGLVGDQGHILSYCFLEREEARSMKTQVIPLKKGNQL